MLDVRNTHALVPQLATSRPTPVHADANNADEHSEPKHDANNDARDELVLARVLAVVVRLGPAVAVRRRGRRGAGDNDCGYRSRDEGLNGCG